MIFYLLHIYKVAVGASLLREDCYTLYSVVIHDVKHMS